MKRTPIDTGITLTDHTNDQRRAAIFALDFFDQDLERLLDERLPAIHPGVFCTPLREAFDHPKNVPLNTVYDHREIDARFQECLNVIMRFCQRKLGISKDNLLKSMAEEFFLRLPAVRLRVIKEGENIYKTWPNLE